MTLIFVSVIAVLFIRIHVPFCINTFVQCMKIILMLHLTERFTEHRKNHKKAPLGFEPRISCLLDRRFNQLSHGAYPMR